MNKKHFVILVISCLFIGYGYAQNLIPFDWKLTFNKNSSDIESIPFNMLLSWQRQGISDLKPTGELQTTFFIPDQKPTDFNLEVTLLAKVESININGHYISGGFRTQFVWAANPNYKVYNSS